MGRPTPDAVGVGMCSQVAPAGPSLLPRRWLDGRTASRRGSILLGIKSSLLQSIESEVQFMEYKHFAVYSGEMNLANALVATPMVGDQDLFSVKDMYLAIADKTSVSVIHAKIYADHPHYILQFDSFEEMNIVERMGTIEGEKFGFVLSRWTKYYKNCTTPWIKEIEIEMTGIPKSLCRSEYVSPIVSPYCDIQTVDFIENQGTCVMVALACSYIAIPTSGMIGFRCIYGGVAKATAVGVSIFARPRVTQDDILHVMEVYCVDGYHPGMVHTAAQFGVDLEVLRDHYSSMQQDENMTYGIRTKEDEVHHGSSDFDYEYEAWELSSGFGTDSD